MDNSTYAFETILLDLQQLCKEKRTGKLRLRTDENYTASIGLVQGKIVSAQYRIKRGVDAIKAFLNISGASFSFDPNAQVDVDSPSLPETQKLFMLLGVDLDNGDSLASQTVAPQRKLLSPTEQTLLTELMTQMIGPMATIICADIYEKTINKRQAVRFLAHEIPDRALGHEFVAKAKVLLHIS